MQVQLTGTDLSGGWGASFIIGLLLVYGTDRADVETKGEKIINRHKLSSY